MRQSCTFVESPRDWLSQDSTSTSSWPYGVAASASRSRSCSSSRVLSFHANAAGEPAGNASSSHANGSKPRNAQGQDAQDDQDDREEEEGGDDDEEADAVPEPKKPAETAKVAAFKEALRKHKQQVLKDEEQRKEEEELKEKARKRLEMERKAKDMLKALPPIPEDGHANHRSWEAQLSASDVKQELQASREMDALRSKQHADPDPGALLAKDLRGAFLNYLGSNSPHHLASASARASAREEADMAHHQSWEAKLTAEDMKNQMLSSRERDSLASSVVGSADANNTLRERDEGFERQSGSRFVWRFGHLAPTDSPGGSVHWPERCPQKQRRELQPGLQTNPHILSSSENDHPALHFSFPVRNVSVTLTNLGKLGKGPEEVVWDAEFSSRKDFKGVEGTMRPTGGTKPRYKPPCFPAKTKYRMQLRVISEDEGEAAGPDRSIDEDAEFEVQLLDRNDPLMQERLKDAENHYDGVRSGDSFGSGTSGSGLPGAVAGPANQDKIGKMLKELMKFEKLGPYIAAVPADVAILAAPEPRRRQPAPRTAARLSYLHFL
eukprot:s2889_g3.t2